MRFHFHINLSDKDYLDYNKFWMLKSPYNKKQVMNFRISIAIVFCVLAFLTLLGNGFSADGWLGAIPCFVLLILLELLLKPFFVMSLKWHIKSLKTKGKMGYSPVAKMEFFDESFTENTPENKSEQKYSAVERVSVIGDKTIYMHVNNVGAYILPISCFESQEQFHDFLDFLRTKCKNVDIY